MEYYKLLQLEREPFSNSPDPNYFFQSRQHRACLQKIELSVRLKRGLNVVVGDMGTGKTTLCRELIRRLAQQESFETHLILDPSFESGRELLTVIYEMLYCRKPDSDATVMALKEALKQILFAKGVEQERTVVIIIDEGQKIPSSCVEILRELLNYETNEFKLLQMIIFAQKEFETLLSNHANFADRINMLHQLDPMSFADTRRMIRHRLKLSGSGVKPLNMFTLPAQFAIYRFSRGYPRRIIHLCHQSILAMIIQNRSRAGWRLIRSSNKRTLPSRRYLDKPLHISPAVIITVSLILVLSVPFLWFHLKDSQVPYQRFKIPTLEQSAVSSVTPVAPDASSPSPPIKMYNSSTAAAENQVLTTSRALTSPAFESQSSELPALAVVSPPFKAIQDSQTQSDLPQQTTEALPSTPQAPSQLGQWTVRAGDTISGMVISVYGTYRNDYVRSVLESNPHIENPDSIQLGDRLLMPAISFNLKSASVDCHWVVLGEENDLTQALLRSDQMTRELRIPVRTVALWSPDKGLYFDLLLQGYFENGRSAQNQVDILPIGFSNAARVISGWDRRTHIFSDPYAGGVRKISSK